MRMLLIVATLLLLLPVVGCESDPYAQPDPDRLQQSALRENEARSRRAEKERARITAQREREAYDASQRIDPDRSPGR
jgi:hypothetical protein